MEQSAYSCATRPLRLARRRNNHLLTITKTNKPQGLTISLSALRPCRTPEISKHGLPRCFISQVFFSSLFLFSDLFFLLGGGWWLMVTTVIRRVRSPSFLQSTPASAQVLLHHAQDLRELLYFGAAHRLSPLKNENLSGRRRPVSRRAPSLSAAPPEPGTRSFSSQRRSESGCHGPSPTG